MSADLESVIEAVLAAKTKPVPEARKVIRDLIARQPKPTKEATT